MKKTLITLLFMSGFCCLSVNAQKPLKKPQKTQTAVTPNKPARQQQAGNKPNKPLKPQKTQTLPSAPRVTATGIINGHGYVDLGLSVKWATCNVGASSPSDYGDYFAWGETSTKSEYTEDNSVTYEKSMGDISGDSRYDAARANWGGTWRLPTKVEIDELVKRCKRKWTTYGGHEGYLITGPNDKSIFLPAAGCYKGTSLDYVGSFGCYWYSTPFEFNIQDAYYLSIRNDDFNMYGMIRSYGRNVRPVSD